MSWHWSGTTRLKFGSLPWAKSVASCVSGTMLDSAPCVPVKFTNGLCLEAYRALLLLGYLNVYGPFAFGPLVIRPGDGIGGRLWKKSFHVLSAAVSWSARVSADTVWLTVVPPQNGSVLARAGVQ